MDYVVDAAIAVKCLLPETHTEVAETLLSDEHTLASPDLVYAEVANVLWKRVVSRDIAGEQAEDALARFLDVEMHIVPAGELVQDALELACQYRRPAYDSLYIALAVRQDAVLVTADKRLRNALKDTPLAPRLAWIGDMHP